MRLHFAWWVPRFTFTSHFQFIPGNYFPAEVSRGSQWGTVSPRNLLWADPPVGHFGLWHTEDTSRHRRWRSFWGRLSLSCFLCSWNSQNRCNWFPGIFTSVLFCGFCFFWNKICYGLNWLESCYLCGLANGFHLRFMQSLALHKHSCLWIGFVLDFCHF